MPEFPKTGLLGLENPNIRSWRSINQKPEETDMMENYKRLSSNQTTSIYYGKRNSQQQEHIYYERLKIVNIIHLLCKTEL